MALQLPAALWHRLDLVTRYWWRVWGREIDRDGAHSWLQTPINERHESGDSWLLAFEQAGMVADDPDAGLLESMADLDGPDFRAGDIHPVIAEFYEHTARFRMEVWNEWTPGFSVGGQLIASLFGQRLEQLSLPMSAIAVSRGMTNAVRPVLDEQGARRGTAWLRRLRSDGSAVYSGFYRVKKLPGNPQPHVCVAFPLEEGAVQVFLAPRADADGSLWLDSRSSRFGADGAYVVARVGHRWFSSLVKLQESFHLYVDAEGILRTDHTLSVYGKLAYRLHYRLDRVAG